MIEWLESVGYLAANLTATRQRDHEMSPGIVWAHPDYIVVLRQRGHLTLMDSTHQTNWLGWILYTLLVRDECGAWRPSAHILAQKEDGDILAAGLRCLKQWAGSLDEIRGQELRYMLTDDSPAEQRVVELAFGGLNIGEREVTHLLCVFHYQHTLKRELGGPACKVAHRHLTAALRQRKTGAGVEESIQNAINSAPASYTTYITNEWWKTRHQWAMAYRSHSPLLLQIPTTSPIEGYHSALKGREGKTNLQQFSLQGIAKMTDVIDQGIA